MSKFQRELFRNKLRRKSKISLFFPPRHFLEIGDMKACVAALSFILSSSARYGVEEDALNNELQQLGLPKEHATALCKIYSENVSALVEKAAAESLRSKQRKHFFSCIILFFLKRNSFNSRCFPFSASILQDVNCIVKEGGKKKIEMDLKINDKIKNQNVSQIVTLSPEQMALLLSGKIFLSFFNPLLEV